MGTRSKPDCSICLSELTSHLAATPCGHVFHHECINQWVQHHSKTCPECKLPTPNNLLRLFFEVREQNDMPDPGGEGEDDDGKGDTTRDEVCSELRRTLVAKTKIMEKLRKKASTFEAKADKLAAELSEEKDQLCKVENRREELQREKEMELFKSEKQINKLRREKKKLEEELFRLGSTKRQEDYLQCFMQSVDKGVGGQVDVEPLVEDCKAGVMDWEELVRKQHTLLTQKTKDMRQAFIAKRQALKKMESAEEELRQQWERMQALDKKTKMRLHNSLLEGAKLHLLPKKIKALKGPSSPSSASPMTGDASMFKEATDCFVEEYDQQGRGGRGPYEKR
ncbi:unnamed protein product, partial [Discosporangium mesarthrocarpum]